MILHGLQWKAGEEGCGLGRLADLIADSICILYFFLLLLVFFFFLTDTFVSLYPSTEYHLAFSFYFLFLLNKKLA